jgi:hypothetical protein
VKWTVKKHDTFGRPSWFLPPQLNLTVGYRAYEMTGSFYTIILCLGKTGKLIFLFLAIQDRRK